jgi:hypothetical protein
MRRGIAISRQVGQGHRSISGKVSSEFVKKRWGKY